MANNLVTEAYLAANFSPKAGITPGSDDHWILNCAEILARYNVTISPSTGNYCPKQSELTGAFGDPIILTKEEVYALMKDTFMIFGDAVSKGGAMSISALSLQISMSGDFSSDALIHYMGNTNLGEFASYFDYDSNDGHGGYIRPNTLYYYRAHMQVSPPYNGISDWHGVTRTVTTATGSPNVGTIPADSITSTQARFGVANPQNGGAPSITAKGVVYSSISGIPTIEDDAVLYLGTGTGSVIGTVYGLIPNTTYYYRGYATNSLGTGYGPILTFTTLP